MNVEQSLTFNINIIVIYINKLICQEIPKGEETQPRKKEGKMDQKVLNKLPLKKAPKGKLIEREKGDLQVWI
jgi:hypothetical protein